MLMCVIDTTVVDFTRSFWSFVDGFGLGVESNFQNQQGQRSQ